MRVRTPRRWLRSRSATCGWSWRQVSRSVPRWRDRPRPADSQHLVPTCVPRVRTNRLAIKGYLSKYEPRTGHPGGPLTTQDEGASSPTVALVSKGTWGLAHWEHVSVRSNPARGCRGWGDTSWGITRSGGRPGHLGSLLLSWPCSSSG